MNEVVLLYGKYTSDLLDSIGGKYKVFVPHQCNSIVNQNRLHRIIEIVQRNLLFAWRDSLQYSWRELKDSLINKGTLNHLQLNVISIQLWVLSTNTANCPVRQIKGPVGPFQHFSGAYFDQQWSRIDEKNEFSL